MKEIDRQILEIDSIIAKNIETLDSSQRGFMSQNILSQLRNFIDHVALKEYAGTGDIENNYDNIVLAHKYIKTQGHLRFLVRFYDFLQIVSSHYALDEENSERLMLKYYEYLLKLKTLLKDSHEIDVLMNIGDFPINTDPALQEYYEKIVDQIENPKGTRTVSPYKDRYYIQKIKPFFVKQRVYYEVTFTIADERVSKFDRVTAFTKVDISDNYSVKMSVIHDDVDIFEKKMPIQIINEWEVSIRPCEFNNFADIFSMESSVQTKHVEYKNLMKYLTKSGHNLLDIVGFESDHFSLFKTNIMASTEALNIIPTLEKAREIVKNKKAGSNIISYLLFKMNNKIIKLQRSQDPCSLLSNLCLYFECIPFDQMPFASSPRGHNPKVYDVFQCVNTLGRDHELFARRIKNNTEVLGQLYTPVKTIPKHIDIKEMIAKYNSSLYLPKHTHRKIIESNDHIHIKGYEDDTMLIISFLKEQSSSGIDNFSNSVDSWLKSSSYIIDCSDKKDFVRNFFEKSKVALLYGSAGTGKTTLINHLANFFSNEKKLFLANTNPATDNLNRKIDAPNSTCKTISKFLSARNEDVDYDLLVIDECSTVSNKDMLDVLNKGNFKTLVFVGDVFQIESITFGNWFSMARSFVSEDAVFELTKPYRTNNEKLIKLWNKVRLLDDNILEHVTKNNYSRRLNKSIFEKNDNDEIILCLNYDGLYGINNINKLLQRNNDNDSTLWGIQTYKIGDPVLFNEANRFTPLIYNNLKGIIRNITKHKQESIVFEIEIEKAINDLQASGYDFDLIGTAPNGNSIISFTIYEPENTDGESSNLQTLIPFQVAYAVSMHKAQGLEYESVKVVITSETEEMITHNIFYTAITRAKERLNIYWTPEAEKKILNNFIKIDNEKDAKLLRVRNTQLEN